MAFGSRNRARRRMRGRATSETAPGPGSAPPVFVGGTGRSGTTIMAELIARSSRYALIPIEIQFHAAPRGLAELLEGRVEVDEFRREILERWYYREPNRNGMRGLHAIAAGHAVEAALARCVANYRKRPEQAAAMLLHELLDPVAKAQGKAGWVEMSPPSIRVADTLGRAMPRAKFIHAVRDGRDVASSVTGLRWGPNDLWSALSWWEEELLAMFKAQQKLPEGQILTLGLEDLVVHRREESYERLQSFLELDDEPAMRAFFDTEMVPERARVGRWRRDLDDAEAREVEAAYQQARSRFEAAGFPLP